MRHKSFFGLSALTLLFVSPTVQAQSGYTITDIGKQYGTSYAYGINNKGQVAGTYYTDYTQKYADAFTYNNGVLSDLGNPGITPQSTSYVAQASAAGINNNGQIVGQYSYTATGDGGHPINPITNGFLYQNGQVQAINLYKPVAINDTGQIVGYVRNGIPSLYQNGVATPLNLTLKDPDAFANVYDINNNGVVVGDDITNNIPYGYYYQNGVEHLLPLLPSSSPGGRATAINDNGQIVGNANIEGIYGHAVLWQNGQITDLGSFGGGSGAYDINSSGVIVGEATELDGQFGAFVYQNGQMTDLFAGSGWHNGWATSINDSGYIVGFGVSPQGYSHAFLAIPTAVPETGSLLTLTVGVILLGILRRKRIAAAR